MFTENLPQITFSGPHAWQEVCERGYSRLFCLEEYQTLYESQKYTDSHHAEPVTYWGFQIDYFGPNRLLWCSE